MAVSTPGSQQEQADAAGGGRGGARRGLGAAFRRMWAAQGISNAGDGVYLTALPLLAASLTRDPLPVSAVMFAQWLPWLLFGLVTGALLDRWDRVRVMWTVDACRFAVVGALAAAVLLGWASIPLLMAVGFLLGTGQTLVDTAAHTLVPALVSRDPRRLERANSRLLGTQVVADQLAGPPLGGALFSVAAWSPFLVDAVSFGLSSALMARLPGRERGRAHIGGPRTTIRADIAEGLRFLLRHRLLRAMAGLVMAVVIASAASDAIL